MNFDLLLRGSSELTESCRVMSSLAIESIMSDSWEADCDILAAKGDGVRLYGDGDLDLTGDGDWRVGDWWVGDWRVGDWRVGVFFLHFCCFLATSWEGKKSTRPS